MAIVPVFAIIDAPIIIGLVVLGALLFGADKLPKLARSAGQAKKEFMVGQLEADAAAAKAREAMQAQANAPAPPSAAPVEPTNGGEHPASH